MLFAGHSKGRLNMLAFLLRAPPMDYQDWADLHWKPKPFWWAVIIILLALVFGSVAHAGSTDESRVQWCLYHIDGLASAQMQWAKEEQAQADFAQWLESSAGGRDELYTERSIAWVKRLITEVYSGVPLDDAWRVKSLRECIASLTGAESALPSLRHVASSQPHVLVIEYLGPGGDLRGVTVRYGVMQCETEAETINSEHGGRLRASCHDREPEWTRDLTLKRTATFGDEPKCEAQIIAEHSKALSAKEWAEVVQIAYEIGRIDAEHAQRLQQLIREVYAAQDRDAWARAKCQEQGA